MLAGSFVVMMEHALSENLCVTAALIVKVGWMNKIVVRTAVLLFLLSV